MRWETTLLQMGNNTGIEVPPEIIDQLGGVDRRQARRLIARLPTSGH